MSAEMPTNMNELNSYFADAVKIKQQDMNRQRQRFLNAPLYLQNTLFHKGEEVLSIRRKVFHEISSSEMEDLEGKNQKEERNEGEEQEEGNLSSSTTASSSPPLLLLCQSISEMIASKIEQGNTFFKLEKWQDALKCYEEGYSGANFIVMRKTREPFFGNSKKGTNESITGEKGKDGETKNSSSSSSPSTFVDADLEFIRIEEILVKLLSKKVKRRSGLEVEQEKEEASGMVFHQLSRALLNIGLCYFKMATANKNHDDSNKLNMASSRVASGVIQIPAFLLTAIAAFQELLDKYQPFHVKAAYWLCSLQMEHYGVIVANNSDQSSVQLGAVTIGGARRQCIDLLSKVLQHWEKATKIRCGAAQSGRRPHYFPAEDQIQNASDLRTSLQTEAAQEEEVEKKKFKNMFTKPSSTTTSCPQTIQKADHEDDSVGELLLDEEQYYPSQKQQKQRQQNSTLLGENNTNLFAAAHAASSKWSAQAAECRQVITSLRQQGQTASANQMAMQLLRAACEKFFMDVCLGLQQLDFMRIVQRIQQENNVNNNSNSGGRGGETISVFSVFQKKAQQLNLDFHDATTVHCLNLVRQEYLCYKEVDTCKIDDVLAELWMWMSDEEEEEMEKESPKAGGKSHRQKLTMEDLHWLMEYRWHSHHLGGQAADEVKKKKCEQLEFQARKVLKQIRLRKYATTQ